LIVLINLSVFGRKYLFLKASEELDNSLTFEEIEFYSSI